MADIAHRKISGQKKNWHMDLLGLKFKLIHLIHSHSEDSAQLGTHPFMICILQFHQRRHTLRNILHISIYIYSIIISSYKPLRIGEVNKCL